MTNFSAKHAWSRLHVHLRDHKMDVPAELWHAMPERTVVYSRRESRELLADIGGWVFEYRDVAKHAWQAIVNCWGEVKITSLEKKYPGGLRGYIDPARWQVDNVEAHRKVLRHDGGSTTDNCGGWLMVVEVEDRGLRPAWAGGAWFHRGTRQLLSVDAETGELYVPTEMRLGKVRFRPLDATNAPPVWNGGFDDRSTEAILGRMDDFYLWPRAYRDSAGRYVYNHRALREALATEIGRPLRDAASFFTSGLLRGVLGDWHDGLFDLDKAIALAPSGPLYREAHALGCLIIRDLDRAEGDFEKLPSSSPHRDTKWLPLLRGKERSNLIGMMRNFDTKTGYLPVELEIHSLRLFRDEEK